MRKLLPVVLVAFVVLAGCKEKEPPPPPPPPLPSQGQIYGALQESIKDFLTGPGGMTREETRQATNRFRQALNENAADPTLYTPEQIAQYQENRKQARRQIQKDIEARIKETQDGGWKVVVACIEAHKVLQPENARYDLLKEKMLAMPKVSSTGGVEVDGELHVFLEVNGPNMNRPETYTVREGETFHPNPRTGQDMFRLTEIIGDNLKYEVEYLEVNDHVFEVESVKKR